MTITRKQAENIASVLTEGLPYIRKFKDKVIVFIALIKVSF